MKRITTVMITLLFVVTTSHAHAEEKGKFPILGNIAFSDSVAQVIDKLMTIGVSAASLRVGRSSIHVKSGTEITEAILGAYGQKMEPIDAPRQWFVMHRKIGFSDGSALEVIDDARISAIVPNLNIGGALASYEVTFVSDVNLQGAVPGNVIVFGNNSAILPLRVETIRLLGDPEATASSKKVLFDIMEAKYGKFSSSGTIGDLEFANGPKGVRLQATGMKSFAKPGLEQLYLMTDQQTFAKSIKKIADAKRTAKASSSGTVVDF